MRPATSIAAASLLLFPADREAADLEAERLAAELVQHDRMRVHEADLSPPDMAGQACWALARYLPCPPPRRILDPTAGAGCFPMAASAQWPDAHITGCEARFEEEKHLEAWCDVHHMGDFFSFAEDGEDDKGFDLVITNPPFSLTPQLLVACLGLVKPGGHVAFVCRLTYGDNPESDATWRRPFLLTHAFEFAGRWRFRVGNNPNKRTPKHPEGKPYGVDSVGYRLLVWRRPPAHGTYRDDIQYRRLDPLPAACRRWRKTRGGLWVKPGTEYLHTGDLEVLPAVPWRP